MTSAVVSKRSLDGFAHLAAKEFYEDDDKHSFTRDDSSTFTDRRTKRLSLSRSLQNLREKADQSRRRSSVSSSKMPSPPLADDLPPVPTLPAMYQRDNRGLSPQSADSRRTASATAQLQSNKQTPPKVAAPPRYQPTSKQTPASKPQKQNSSSSGLGAFFRKLTGRKNKDPPKVARHPSVEPARTINRRPTEASNVVPPASVRGVLAEMGASSSATERRHSHRKSTIKRVPVPVYDPDTDVLIRRTSADRHNKVPMPENALDARAAALLALEGSPPIGSTARLGNDVSPPTPESTRPALDSGDSDSSEGPVIKTVSTSPPLVTHVLVMEPESTGEPEVSATDNHISPRRQSVKLVASRSTSGSSIDSGVNSISSIKRMSKTRKLSDFGTYDSSDGSDEGADVARPLQLRIPPRITTTTVAESGNISPRTPRTPLSPYLPITPEDGPAPDTPTSSGFDHSSVGHRASQSGEYSYNSFERSTTSGSARSPRTPYTVYSTYSGSNSGHSARDARFAGSRSAYVAPVGDGLSTDSHGRVTSRIRTTRTGSLGRRLSQKPKEPPTSHDAYMQKQAQLLNRRESCKPVIHSRASIAAELTEVRDKEASHVMETFFMS